MIYEVGYIDIGNDFLAWLISQILTTKSLIAVYLSFLTSLLKPEGQLPAELY